VQSYTGSRVNMNVGQKITAVVVHPSSIIGMADVHNYARAG